MSRVARSDAFDPLVVSTFHCYSRTVRRAFLCGVDPLSGCDYSHRKEWIQQRLQFVASCFGIDVLVFAVLSNHFHVVLRNRPDIVAQWSDSEVARRWCLLCPSAEAKRENRAECPSQAELDLIRNNPQRLAEIRKRLSDISWLMRMVCEPIARQSNAEDGCTGRFWEGRFKAVKLCDLAALLVCSIYVDLNPIRAHVARTLQESEHTSARLRIDSCRRSSAATQGAAEYAARRRTEPQPRVDEWLAPLELVETGRSGPQPSCSSARASDRGFLPLSLENYLLLLDWTGRQVTGGKSGSLPPDVLPILAQLGIESCDWLRLATGFGQLFHRVAGSHATLCREARRRRRHHYRGRGQYLIAAA